MEIQSIEENPSPQERGDVCLDSTSTYLDHDSFLIDVGASYHMTPYRYWFYKYQNCGGGDFLFKDDSLTNIVKQGNI